MRVEPDSTHEVLVGEEHVGESILARDTSQVPQETQQNVTGEGHGLSLDPRALQGFQEAEHAEFFQPGQENIYQRLRSQGVDSIRFGTRVHVTSYAQIVPRRTQPGQ